jgi:hypothetical protein
MSIFSKIFGSSKQGSEKSSTTTPKPVYKHYGQRPKSDSKRQNKFGPKKD